MILRAAILVAALFAATEASAFRATNGFEVKAEGPVTFSVWWRGGGTGAIDFWCAAGEYAWRRLNAANNARIYRLSEPVRRAGQPVFYSLDPTGAASSTGLAVVGGEDGSLSVATARNQCAAARILRKTY
jgi:hypothetical protein